MQSSAAARTKRAQKVGSLADQGLVLAPYESVYLRCDTLSSMLRVRNITSSKSVTLPAAACLQRHLGYDHDEITGDELPSHLPVGWGQSHQVRFQVMKWNADLLPGGSRELVSLGQNDENEHQGLDHDPRQQQQQQDQVREYTMEELVGMVKPLPGSEHKKNHYLGYRRSIWRALKHQVVDLSTSNKTKVNNNNINADIVLDVMTGTALPTLPWHEEKKKNHHHRNNKNKNNNQQQHQQQAIIIPDALHGASVAFVVPKQPQQPQTQQETPADRSSNKACHVSSSKAKLPQSNDSTTTTSSPSWVLLDAFTKSIGTSGCVSLLQKIIRRRPQTLTHPDRDTIEFDAATVLAAVVQRLLDPQQAGMFLPDQGVYVSAQQHFLKRLLVIMAEDGEYCHATACQLAASALLLECDPAWIPPALLQAKWQKVAIDLWQSPWTSDYDNNDPVPQGKKQQQQLKRKKTSPPVPFDAWRFPSLVLEELGAMRGDKDRMRWLGTNINDNKRNALCDKTKEPTGTDSLDVYCDQHVCGNIVYLWCPRTKKGPARTPYGPELEMAFHLVSGVNPRRRQGHNFTPLSPPEQKLHIQAIHAAMKEASKMIRGIVDPFPTIAAGGTPIDYPWCIPDGALAGMIGPVEVRVAGNKALLVTVDPANLQRWVVIPKPSRNSNLSDVSSMEKEEGLERAGEIFANGIKLRTVSHPSLEGLVAKYCASDGKWTVGGIDWNEKRKVTFSIVQYPEWNEENPSLPFECPNEYDDESIQWVAGRLGGYEPIIQMPTISRDGSGTKESLTGVESYSLLRQLSLKYPDALWPTGLFSFETRCIPLRLEIRKRLLSSLHKPACSPYPAWADDRKLRPLQKDALEGLMTADKSGMGTFLWMLVGSGKTMTVLSFIDMTRRSSSTVWCLPMSAMRSVAKEIRRAGWSVRVLASSVGRLRQHDWASASEATLETTLQPGTITLIEHDDVRNLVSALSPQMIHTTFVYDEVHKAMAPKTLRTGSALHLARLAKQLVALTGTPIVDSRAYMLMKWLRFCVPFQVHSRNFWVAANSMIANLAATPVQVERRTVSVPLNTKQAKSIDACLPPRLGGIARKPDFKKAYDLSKNLVDQWLVQETMRAVYGKRKKPPLGCPQGQGHPYAVAVTRLFPPSQDIFDHLPQRVLLVAADRQHGADLVNALLKKGAPADEVMFIGGRTRPESLPENVEHASSVCFTAEEWRRNEWVPNICVAPISYCEGYSLTWMTTLVTGVYPSNQAKRTQMEGRINRANCERLHRTYITAMAGLTEIMYKYQRDAKNLESALAALSKTKAKAL